MWIESLHIDAFGGLRGFSMEFTPGLTVICGANESGKSTVMAFIRAMLYGMNGRSASLQLNDRKRCAPWDGTAMSGSLRLRDGGTVYEIRRSFGQTRKGDTCRVVEAETGEIVPIPAGEEPGDVLLGVDEATFADTLFLSWQGSRLTGDGEALGEKIRNLAGTGREDVDLVKLLDRLRDARSAIQPRTKDRGALADTRKALDAARTEKLKAAQREKRIAQLKQQVHELTAQQKRSGELDALQLREEDLTGLIRDLEERRKQLRWRRPCGVACIAAGVLLAMAGGAAGALMQRLWLLTLIPAVVLAVVGAQLCRDRIGGELFELMAERESLRAQKARLSGQEAQGREERLVELRVELAALEREQQDGAALDGRITALEAKEVRLERTVAALDMAQEELRAAAKERQSDFVPELTRGMEEILSRVTQGRYAQAAVSRSLELSLQTEQGVQPWGYFSTGTVELMYLALRLSLAGLLQRRCGALPVLLDDPFLCLDDARAARCMQVVDGFAQDGQQALLFTCRQSMAQGCARVIHMDANRA